MAQSPPALAETFRALGLAELNLAAALQERVDTKYVISLAEFEALCDRLGETHRVLDIHGRRAFGYRSTYFDTDELRTFRDHVQERRRRYKVRSREYLDSGECAFEVKLKGFRGRTVKHRMAYHRARRDELSEPAIAFVRECIERAYGRGPEGGELRAQLAVAYTRVTLAAPALGERVTCDFDLAFGSPCGASGRLAEDTVIVESKSASGKATADRLLRALGARPEERCSKYCLGVGLTRPDVRSNKLRPLLRRHFRAVPAAVAVLAFGAAVPATVAAEIPRIDLRAAEKLRDEPKVPAQLTVGGRSYRVAAERRGQATQLLPRQSYAVEARRRIRPLGMPAERDWVLNAVAADPSRMRDVLAHATARRLGLAASRTRYVRLRLNGRPRGVYVLMEQPELSRRRVTGEALLELTEVRKLDRGDESFPSAFGLSLRYVEPDEAGKKDARAARRATAAFEAALGGPGWRAHLDERSAVDYVLLAELFGNQDTFLSSTFVHLRKDGRLAMGPVWDFDLSAGNVVLPVLAATEGWMHADRVWAGALHADPGFRAALSARWHGLRAGGLLEALLRDADRRARTLHARGAHAAAVAALKDWLVRRATWMDAALVKPPAS